MMEYILTRAFLRGKLTAGEYQDKLVSMAKLSPVDATLKFAQCGVGKNGPGRLVYPDGRVLEGTPPEMANGTPVLSA
jgi:hypothetical protein